MLESSMQIRDFSVKLKIIQVLKYREAAYNFINTAY